MWVDDIATVLVAAAVGTQNASIFTSTKAEIPTGNGPYLSIIETPGLPPVRMYSAVPNTVDYKQPAAQILVRARNAGDAFTMARAAWNALAAIRNQLIGTTWHLYIRPQQEPYDLGVDDNDRARVAFNVLGYNRP
jgi:hypothetical protein